LFKLGNPTLLIFKNIAYKDSQQPNDEIALIS